MKKKTKIILGVLGCLLLLAYIGYKMVWVYQINISNKSIVNETDIYENVGETHIQRDTHYQNDSTNTLRFYVPENFALEEKESNEKEKVYYVKDENGNIQSIIAIGEGNHNSPEELFEMNNKNILRSNQEKLFKKYHIDNEMDLYRYYIDHHKEKANIFNSLSHLQMDAFVSLYMLVNSVGGPDTKSYLVTGDVDGFLVESSHFYYMIFFYKDKKYVLNTFGPNLIEREEFLKIVNSISFEG